MKQNQYHLSEEIIIKRLKETSEKTNYWRINMRTGLLGILMWPGFRGNVLDPRRITWHKRETITEPTPRG